MVRLRGAGGPALGLGRALIGVGDVLSNQELRVIASVRGLPPPPFDAAPADTAASVAAQASTPALLPSAAGGNQWGGWGMGVAPIAPPPTPRRPEVGVGAGSAEEAGGGADTDGAGDLLLALSGKTPVRFGR